MDHSARDLDQHSALMIGVSDKRKEASIYGAFAVVIIFVVGLFSEILLGIGTRFAIIWPLVKYFFKFAILNIFLI